MVSPLVQALAFQNSVNPVPAAVAPTDVVGSYRLAHDMAEKNYAAKLAERNAMFGGLAGLGGAGLLAFGPSAARSIFGTPTAATPAAAPIIPSTGFNLAPTASGTTMAWPGATGVADAGTGAGAAGGSIAADFGAPSAAAGSVAADLGAAGAGDALAAGATDVAASMPEWLAALLALA